MESNRYVIRSPRGGGVGVVVTLYFSAIHNEMLRFINYLIIIAVFVTVGGGLFVIFVEDLEHSEQWESPQWCLRCIILFHIYNSREDLNSLLTALGNNSMVYFVDRRLTARKSGAMDGNISCLGTVIKATVIFYW